MKKQAIRFCMLVLACSGALLLPLAVSAQEPQAANSSVTPAPRQGAPHERYLKINQAVQQNRGPLDLVFIGDSITQGWETNGKEAWQKYYGRRKALNLGIGGDRTQHVIWRLDNGNADGIQPKAAVVMIGTNNSGDDRNTAPEMVEGVKAVVAKIREKLPEARILLLGIFPRGEDFNAQRGKILQVNQVIRQLDDGRSVQYLDIGHLFLGADGKISKTIMPDFLHLTPQGYEIWAEAIEPKLRELLGEGAAPAAVTSPAGEWAFTIRGPSGEQMDLLLKLGVQGETLTGTLETGDGQGVGIEKGALKGNALSFTVRRPRSDGTVRVYEAKGTIEGEEMRGTVNALSEGVTVEWSARRKK